MSMSSKHDQKPMKYCIFPLPLLIRAQGQETEVKVSDPRCKFLGQREGRQAPAEFVIMRRIERQLHAHLEHRHARTVGTATL